MHYGDEDQLKESELEFIIYKHEVLGAGSKKRNKDGFLSKRAVDFEIASIQNCKYFNPRSLLKIMKDPYKYFVKVTDRIGFEEWIRVKIVDHDGYSDVEVKVIEIVSDHPNDFYRLH